jgi:GTP cyclohydrolase I
VLIEARHTCMTTRGVVQPGTSAVTSRFTGVFADSADWRNRFFAMVAQPQSG